MGPLSKFRNRSLLVVLLGGVKELRAFPVILQLSETCIQPGPAPPHKCPAEFMAFTTRSTGSTTGRSPPQLAQTWVLKMYARRPIWMWLSQRALPNPGELSELAQIFNSTNSAGPLSKRDLSITDVTTKWHEEQILSLTSLIRTYISWPQ